MRVEGIVSNFPEECERHVFYHFEYLGGEFRISPSKTRVGYRWSLEKRFEGGKGYFGVSPGSFMTFRSPRKAFNYLRMMFAKGAFSYVGRKVY